MTEYLVPICKGRTQSPKACKNFNSIAFHPKLNSVLVISTKGLEPMTFAIAARLSSILLCPRAHHAGRIGKRMFHSENAANGFPSTVHQRNHTKWNHIIIVIISLFSEWFSSTVNCEAGIFKFLRFDERFRKAPFSCQLGVDGSANRWIKVAFSNFSDVVS